MNAAAQQAALTFKMHRKPAVAVLSVEDAAAKWNAYREAMADQGVGCSRNGGIGNGGIVREGKKIVARISYNGRIWSA